MPRSHTLPLFSLLHKDGGFCTRFRRDFPSFPLRKPEQQKYFFSSTAHREQESQRREKNFLGVAAEAVVSVLKTRGKDRFTPLPIGRHCLCITTRSLFPCFAESRSLAKWVREFLKFCNKPPFSHTIAAEMHFLGEQNCHRRRRPRWFRGTKSEFRESSFLFFPSTPKFCCCTPPWLNAMGA